MVVDYPGLTQRQQPEIELSNSIATHHHFYGDGTISGAIPVIPIVVISCN